MNEHVSCGITRRQSDKLDALCIALLMTRSEVLRLLIDRASVTEVDVVDLGPIRLLTPVDRAGKIATALGVSLDALVQPLVEESPDAATEPA